MDPRESLVLMLEYVKMSIDDAQADFLARNGTEGFSEFYVNKLIEIENSVLTL